MKCQIYKYLGIDRYNEIEKTEVLNPESQIYKFSINNEVKKYKIYPGKIIKEKDINSEYTLYKCEDGAYPIQNQLIKGYEYILFFDNDYIKSIKQLTIVDNKYKPPIKCIPGVRTLKNLISTAFQPVGTTLYIFGGGWDFQDIGASNETRTIGISPNWVKFFDEQNSNYTYKDYNNKNMSYYPFKEYNVFYYAGLDCSGYVGWVLYNTFYTKSLSEKGFVTYAKKMAKSLADKNYGKWMHKIEGTTNYNPNYKILAEELKVGDLISSTQHVMIVLGKCKDNSFIVFHSSPSNSKKGYPGGGVQISAVNIKDSGSINCEAYSLCKEYMEKYFKKWSERYEVIVIPTDVVFDFDDIVPTSGIFHWDLDKGIMNDPENYSLKSAKEILIDLFR